MSEPPFGGTPWPEGQVQLISAARTRRSNLALPSRRVRPKSPPSRPTLVMNVLLESDGLPSPKQRIRRTFPTPDPTATTPSYAAMSWSSAELHRRLRLDRVLAWMTSRLARARNRPASGQRPTPRLQQWPGECSRVSWGWLAAGRHTDLPGRSERHGMYHSTSATGLSPTQYTLNGVMKPSIDFA